MTSKVAPGSRNGTKTPRRSAGSGGDVAIDAGSRTSSSPGRLQTVNRLGVLFVCVLFAACGGDDDDTTPRIECDFTPGETTPEGGVIVERTCATNPAPGDAKLT